ncbi:MAG: thioester domain-containing protein [Solirubrobacteraceae bacterium]
MSGTGNGQSVAGFIATATNTFDPVKDGYPSSNPSTGGTPPLWNTLNEGFAGIIRGQPTDGSTELRLYCIDILTETYGGIGYYLGTWDAANVPNVDYVGRLLNEYYPNKNEPASLTDLNQRAAAVQAAIWFFTDRYVLNTSDPLRPTVVDIVDHIIKEGPLVEPVPPSLTITPASVSGPAGSVLGPFTVNTNSGRHHHFRSGPDATVTATGGDMFSDSAGTVPILNGTTVPSGTKIWVRSTGPSIVVLEATAEAVVHSGNVYLYDGNSGVSDAQHLILAETGHLRTTVKADAEFLPPGSLVVEKTIGGPAAGSQAHVVIHVACDDGVARDDFTIPAGTPAGTKSKTYAPIAAGTMCTVTETSNGSVVGTNVVVIHGAQEATIPSGGTETVKIKDIYYHVGSLLVRKTIAGPAAGQQGQITIHSECDGKALTPDFVIPAGTPAGDQTKQYDNIRLPARCTVTETVDGHTSTVSVDVVGSGQTVSVPAGDIAEADISDTYGLVPGQLEVTKSITGPLAGQQGPIVIHTVCNGTALSPDLVIPPGATGDHSQMYSNIPTPASCVVTETVDGATSTVSVVVTGSPDTVTIPPGGSGSAQITDTYGSAPGSLLVTKTIAGPLAGRQGPVTINVVCDGIALSPNFVVAAGTHAGNASQSFDDIPAGSVCTVTETADGATTTVTATVSGNNQTVTVPAGKVVSVNLMDLYQQTPGLAPDVPGPSGTLKVTKTIAGPAAHQHGPISILVDCGGPIHTYAFRIPAHTGPASVSRYYPDLPAGSRCTVTETTDGRTSTVAVTATGKSKKVTIHANRTATVHLTDTFFGVQSVAVTG